MELMGDILRGHTDMILLSLLNHKDSYGYEINHKIQELTQDAFMFTEATLYTSFKRLEQLEYITSYWQEGENLKRRKYYSITNKGKLYLNTKIKSFNEAFETIFKIINT
ncbi:MAG: PadR family transcriptional regulator [Candidatus Izemoplasmataceae bacterium]|jgi:PadR family transcriptional regulator, regulatory protein PadR